MGDEHSSSQQKELAKDWSAVLEEVRKARKIITGSICWQQRNEPLIKDLVALLIVVIIIIVLLMTRFVSMLPVETEPPSAQLLTTVYTSVFSVSVTVVSIVVAIFVFAAKNASESLREVHKEGMDKIKQRFCHDPDVDDEMDKKIWVELWRRLDGNIKTNDIDPLDWPLEFQRAASKIGREIHLRILVGGLPRRTLFGVIPLGLVAVASILLLAVSVPLAPGAEEDIQFRVILAMLAGMTYLGWYLKWLLGSLWKENRQYFCRKAAELNARKWGSHAKFAKVEKDFWAHLDEAERILRMLGCTS